MHYPPSKGAPNPDEGYDWVMAFRDNLAKFCGPVAKKGLF
jgi:hypothetical protein